MSSTSLDAPPRRLKIAAVIIVVGLHLLTALAAIKTPELKVEAEKNTAPIEIELVTLPTEDPASEVEVTEIAPKEEPKPQAKPVVQPKPKTPAKPVVEKKTAPKAAPKEPVKKQQTQDKPKDKKIEPKVDTAAADEQRRLIAAQTKAAADAKTAAAEKAARDAQANRDAQAQTARDAANAKAARDAAETAARAKATRDAQAKAAADAKAAKEAAEKAAAAASNTPVNFTASAANWASAPNFSFPDSAARRATSGETFTVVLTLRVNKQGGIDSVGVAKSSGNTRLDKEAQRQVRSGKFKPFTKNGAPVVGNVTLPVAYRVP